MIAMTPQRISSTVSGRAERQPMESLVAESKAAEYTRAPRGIFVSHPAAFHRYVRQTPSPPLGNRQGLERPAAIFEYGCGGARRIRISSR